MRQLLILSFLAILCSSCERDCEAFDKSREIAKWHLFPDLNSEYSYVAGEETKVFSKIRGEISPFETIKCFTGCDCTRRFTAHYEEGTISIQSNIAYDQDNEWRPTPISYSIDYSDVEFNVTSSGEFILMDEDSVLYNPGLLFEHFDTLTIGNNIYQRVLHISKLRGDITDIWVERSTGMVAFQEDSIQYIWY